MSYLVLARKYRPQTFKDVVSQSHITKTLTNSILADRIAHAIIFSGPRGTGKTTMARILAKAMNCKIGPTSDPCNKCPSCLEITAGNSVDVFEIDGASNNGVDHIRDLRENVKYMPARSRYKIYIIDEVHMLSAAAFNALLKTLEEPPSHILFIFATTEPHKIPITILSRCQRYDFRRVNIGALINHLGIICEKEKVIIEKESLYLIAREAGGSVRDSLSLLDLVISSERSPISHKNVVNILGIVDRKDIFDISKYILKSEIQEFLILLDGIYNRGHDIKKLYSDIVEHFRNLLIVKNGKDLDRLLDIPAHEIELMQSQVKDISPLFLIQLFDILFNAENSIKFSSQPKINLEIIFIKMSQVKPVLQIDALIEKIDLLRKEISYHQDIIPDKKKITIENNGNNSNNENIKNVSDVTSEAVNINETDITKIWEKLFKKIEDKFPLTSAYMHNSILKRLTDKEIEIELKGNNNTFNLNMLRREKQISNLKEICSAFLGKNIDIIITSDNNSEKNNENIIQKTDILKKDALNNQIVKDAVEIFNARIVDIKLL